MIKIIIEKCSKVNLKARNVTFLNPYSYLLARKNRDVFSQFDQIHIDGIALVKILKLFGLADVERKSFDMTSLAPIVFKDAIKTSRSIYFIGTEPGVIDLAVENIRSLYSELKIEGYRDGYFDGNSDRERTLKNIFELKPDIIICGMGTPLQEKFLLDLKKLGWEGIGYTCGGFLHQIAKKIDYYPKWIDKYHLRWVFRIYDEPKLFKRYFLEYPKFLIVFLYDYINYKVNNIHTNTKD